MVVQCSAFGCDTKYSPETRRENITFYKFPLHDPVRLDSWTNAVNYGVPSEKRLQPNQYCSLCSQHFEDKYFDKSGPIYRLRVNAIPTKFNGKTLKIVKPVNQSIMRTPQSASRKINTTSVKTKSRLLSSAKSKPHFKSILPKATPNNRTSTPSTKYTPRPIKKNKPIARVNSLLKLQPVMHPAISKTLVVRLNEEEPFCCVPQCETETGREVSYVTLPSDNERYEEWVTLMGRPDLLNAEGTTKAKNAVICSTHFAEEMWVKSKTRNSRLVKHAVPSIFPIHVKQETTDSDDEYYVPPKSVSTKGVKRKLSVSPSKSNRKIYDNSEDDYAPKRAKSAKFQHSAKKKLTGITKANVQASFGSNLTCPVCSRELSKWDRLKNHLVNIHDYYINENDELVPPFGAQVDDDDSTDSEPMPPSEFLQVNLFEGTDAKSQTSKDKGIEAVLKLKWSEIEDLKKEIETLKVDTEGTVQEKKDDKEVATANTNKATPELKYTAEDKKLWENLIMAEIKKSKKYMEGLEKAQKILNSQAKEIMSLKQQLKKSADASSKSPSSSTSYAMKKRLNEEIQKNKKLHDRVRQLLDENKNQQKSSGDSSRNDKLSSMFLKLKRAEENLKSSNIQISDQNKKFRTKYTQQTKQFQRKIKQSNMRIERLQKKAKMMNARLNGIREIGSISQIIRDSAKYLTNQQVTFCEGQMKANTNSNEKFWSPAFQELIHNMYQTSPKAYKIYQKFFALPSINVVKKWISENELVTRGINEAILGAFTEEAKSLHELEEKYDNFTNNGEELIAEQNNNTKMNGSEENSSQQFTDNVQQQTNVGLEDESFNINGLENIPDQDEDEMEEVDDEEEDEGRITEKNEENTDDALFDSDDEEEGILKSDDDLEDLGDSDWSNDSNAGDSSRRLTNNSMLK